jgi:hypothetical protein
MRVYRIRSHQQIKDGKATRDVSYTQAPEYEDKAEAEAHAAILDAYWRDEMTHTVAVYDRVEVDGKQTLVEVEE